MCNHQNSRFRIAFHNTVKQITDMAGVKKSRLLSGSSMIINPASVRGAIADKTDSRRCSPPLNFEGFDFASKIRLLPSTEGSHLSIRLFTSL